MIKRETFAHRNWLQYPSGGENVTFLFLRNSRMHRRTIIDQENPANKPENSDYARDIKCQRPAVIEFEITQEPRQWHDDHRPELSTLNENN